LIHTAHPYSDSTPGERHARFALLDVNSRRKSVSHAATRIPALPPMLVIVMFSLCAMAEAQEALPKDSALYWLRDGVLVTGMRGVRGTNTAVVESFDAGEIAAIAAASVGDILKAGAGGSVIEYGPHGSLQLATYRGFGPEYTAVYLNGVRINQAQNSLVDFSRMPLASAESIEIARGGYSSLYGSDALGGVVSIRTSPSTSPLAVSLGGGSFGWRSASLSSGLAGARGSLRLSGYYEDARNDFPIASRTDRTAYGLVRANADCVQRVVEMQAAFNGAASRLALFSRYGSTEVGIPGALVSIDQGQARQSDRELISTISWLHMPGTRMLVEIAGSMLLSDEGYRDPRMVVNGTPLSSEYRNLSATLTARVEGSVLPWLHASTGLETQHARLTSDMVVGTPRRTSIAAWCTGDASLQADGEGMHVVPAFRVEAIDNHRQGDRLDWQVSPSLGFRIPVGTDRLAFRGRVAYGRKLPTFNQLYWSPGGNPALRSESALTSEVGVSASIPAVDARLDITGHWDDLHDRIIWMPVNAAYWAPRNIQRVASRGVEASCLLRVPGTDITIRCNGQYLSSTKASASFAGDSTEGKQLPYTPWLTAGLVVSWQASRMAQISITMRANGARYGDEMNSAAARLDPCVLSDAACVVTAPGSGLRWKLKAECFNLFDTAYESVQYYPMPGRSFKLTMFTDIAIP
jgi:vitamin B12 transporter